jgi:hypothetical protein
LHVLRGVAIDFVQPLLDIVERILNGDVVHDDNAVSAAIVRAGDGAEALLTGSVPLKTTNVEYFKRFKRG